MTTAMMKFATLCLVALLLFGSSVALAADDAPQRDRGPIKITADRLEVDDQIGELVFSGHAVAVQDDVTIHGDRLTVTYAGEKRDIQQVIAEGSVRITQATRLATGARAVLYYPEQRVVLSGSPKVSEGEDFVLGQEITIFLNDKRSVVTGGSGGRVNAVFTPRAEARP